MIQNKMYDLTTECAQPHSYQAPEKIAQAQPIGYNICRNERDGNVPSSPELETINYKGEILVFKPRSLGATEYAKQIILLELKIANKFEYNIESHNSIDKGDDKILWYLDK